MTVPKIIIGAQDTARLPVNVIKLLFTDDKTSGIPDVFRTKCIKVIPVELSIDVSQRKRKQSILSVKTEVWDFSTASEGGPCFEMMAMNSQGLVIIVSEESQQMADEYLESKLNILSNRQVFLVSVGFDSSTAKYKPPSRIVTSKNLTHARITVPMTATKIDNLSEKEVTALRELFSKYMAKIDVTASPERLRD